MRRTCRTFLLLIGLISISASPVSRVGGGTLSNDEIGYSTTLPGTFAKASIFRNQNVQFEGRSSSFGPYFIMVNLLSNDQSEWAGKTDRDEFWRHFQTLGWQRLSHRVACIEQWQKQTAEGVTRVLSWGNGQGIVIAANVKHFMEVEQLGSQLALKADFCAWK